MKSKQLLNNLSINFLIISIMVDINLMAQAEQLVKENQEAIARVEVEICNIGCEFCANCSGIVGG